MATFISLVSFTDQGARNIKESPNRAEVFQATATKFGAQVKSLYWTNGQYDVIATLEGPEEAVMAALAATATAGNVRTQTLRGFSVSEMRKLVADLK